MDEIRNKRVQVDSVFGAGVVFVDVTVISDEVEFWIVNIAMIITIFILVLLLKPKDFFVGENELCRLCRVLSPTNNNLNFSLGSRRTLGDEMHRHLKLLRYYLWNSGVAYGNIVVSIYYRLSLGCLRKKMRKKSRGNHLRLGFFAFNFFDIRTTLYNCGWSVQSADFHDFFYYFTCFLFSSPNGQLVFCDQDFTFPRHRREKGFFYFDWYFVFN